MPIISDTRYIHKCNICWFMYWQYIQHNNRFHSTLYKPPLSFDLSSFVLFKCIGFHLSIFFLLINSYFEFSKLIFCYVISLFNFVLSLLLIHSCMCPLFSSLQFCFSSQMMRDHSHLINSYTEHSHSFHITIIIIILDHKELIF